MSCSILRRPRAVAVVIGVAALVAAPVVVRAQTSEGSVSKPEVTRLTIKGVKSVNEEELLSNLALEQSHCVSMLLKPFCLFSKSHLFYERAYLDRDELARDVLRARVFYFKRGFRDTSVDTTVSRAGRDAVHVLFRVNEGPPTLVSGISVTQTNPVLSQRDIARRLVLKAGDPFSLLGLDSTQVLLRNRLWDRGYSDAVLDTAVVLDSAARSAAVAIRVDPRWQARVASVDVEGNKKVSARTIRKSLSFESGDLYRRSDVLKSQRSLYESNLFRRAAITVPEADDSLKHVRIVVQEGPMRDARVSAGFSTIDFVQVQGRYTNYNWLGGAKRLTLDGTVGNLLAQQLNGNGIFYNVGRTVVGGSASRYLSPTYSASAEFAYPWFGSPDNQAAVSVFSHRRSAPGIYVDRGFGATATFTRMAAERGPVSINYRFEVTNVDAGDVYFCVNFGVCDRPTLTALRANQMLSPLGLTFSLDKTDNPFEPRRGYRTQLGLEHASRFTASDFRYNRGNGEVAMFLPLGTRSVLGGHIRLGYVQALASTIQAVGLTPELGGTTKILHPRKRFYSGGSQSVRGYGESQLGPRVLTVPAAKLLANDTMPGSQCTPATIRLCNPNTVTLEDRDFLPRPLGGNELAEASVEFRFPLFGDFIGATFVDAGFVSQNTNPGLPKSKAAITPGFGVRYKSPVGPVRIDVGINPVTTEDLPVVTEDVNSGNNGSLITLRQFRKYAPVERSGGVNALLSRLTLHLSIGEAF